MERKTRSRLLLLLLLVVLAAGTCPGPVGAQQTDRAKSLGKRLICMCGCNQILTACNHVGCTVSSSMLKKLDVLVARSEPDDLTLQSFVQEYGEQVMAEPPAKGFNRLAWFIPGIAFGLGLVIVLVVIAHWRRRVVLAPAGVPGTETPPEFLARARRQADEETEE
jgi:cytochrome c-type biogenesis protein CcmH